ncbi:putative protein kinase RLK-Pelle-DLSV family [Helianthus annuus]|nr:putative protein kinase RLK-Pelle-DLSV family [Helianthus annuus]
MQFYILLYITINQLLKDYQKKKKKMLILLLFLQILSGNFHLATAQSDFWSKQCGTTGNHTPDHPSYKLELDNILYRLTGTNNGFGYYNSTFRKGEVVALCRGDLEPEPCRRCVDDATRRLIQVCPDQYEAAGWYDTCFLYFSGITKTIDSQIYWYNGFRYYDNASSFEEWNKTVWDLLDKLQLETSGGGPLRKYASGSSTASGSKIFGMMQCLPVLSAQQCNDCLDDCLFKASELYKPVPLKKQVTIYKTSCIMRYGNQPFFNATWFPNPTSSGPEPEQVDERIVTLPEPDQAGCSHDARSNPEIIIEDDGTGEVHSFSLSTIQVATNNFSLENVLGEGGFGSVYKGVLENGQAIAVKRLSRNSSQGVVEFKTEVNLVAKVQHRNLVRLLGYCVQGPERLLVYEYMANNSLDTILFDDEKCKELDWVKRAKIISGIANGLRYLHEESRVKIIHRDLKTSNILLDEDMNSLISDFGTARIVGQKQNYAVTQQTIGTYGYMAPEYAMHGRFSTKSDVFGFGMVLLEIVCGQKNNHFRHKNQPEEFLLTASRLWRANKGEELIDGRLALNIPIGKVIRWIHIALLCVEEMPGKRPSMSTVVSMLSDQGSGSLPEPINPPMVPRRDERHTEPTMTMDNVGEIFTGVYQPRYTQTSSKFKKKIYEWNSD